MRVGSDASSAADICRLYGVTSEPVVLFSATVTGQLAGLVTRKTAKRKSFQIDVNCQIAGDDERRRRERQHDRPVRPEHPRAVHARRLDQILRDRRVVAAEDERRDRDPVHDVREREPRDARREVDRR